MHSLLGLPDDGSALDEAAVGVLCFGDGAPPEGEWHGATPLRRACDAPCAASDGRQLHVLGSWDGEEDESLASGESTACDDKSEPLAWQALPPWRRRAASPPGVRRADERSR
eukprot:332128-Prymnesium_polylepis.1